MSETPTAALVAFASTTSHQQTGSLPLGLAVVSACVVTAAVWAFVTGLRGGGLVSLRRPSARRSPLSAQLQQLAWLVLPALFGWVFAMVLLGAVLPQRLAVSVDLIGLAVIIVGASGLLVGAAALDWLSLRHTNEERVARGGSRRRRLLDPFQGAVLDIVAAVGRTMVFLVLTMFAWTGVLGHNLFPTAVATSAASPTMTTAQQSWVGTVMVYMAWAGFGVWMRHRHRRRDWDMQEKLLAAEDARFLATSSGSQDL